MKKNELQRHKRSDTVKWIISFTLIAILLLGMVGGVLELFTKYKPSEWFKKADETKEVEAVGDVDTGGLRLPSSVTEAGIGIKAYNIARTSFAAYGVSELSDSAQEITVTLSPEGVTFPEVDYAVAFEDPASEWATGKDVSEYVTCTPTEDGALTAVVECKQAFGEKIVITVSWRDDAAVNAKVNVDYARRIKDVNFYFENADTQKPFVTSSTPAKDWKFGFRRVVTDNKPNQVSPSFDYSDYTVTDSNVFTVTLTFRDNFKNELQTQSSIFSAGQFSQWFDRPITLQSSQYMFEIRKGIYGIQQLFGPAYNVSLAYTPLINALQTMAAKDDPEEMAVFDLNVTVTGEHSTYTKSFAIGVDPTYMLVSAASVTVDKEGIVF